jgi:hypothetical protein
VSVRGRDCPRSLSSFVGRTQTTGSRVRETVASRCGATSRDLSPARNKPASYRGPAFKANHEVRRLKSGSLIETRAKHVTTRSDRSVHDHDEHKAEIAKKGKRTGNQPTYLASDLRKQSINVSNATETTAVTMRMILPGRVTY